MERLKLKQAREAKGLREQKRISQQDVADAIGCSLRVYNMWERNQCDPQQYYVDRLVEYFGVKDPKELDLVPGTMILSLEEKVQMFEGYSRREVLTALQGLSIFSGVDLVALVENTHIADDEYLDECSASLKACWDLMRHNGLVHVESIVSTCMTRLTDLASHESDIQGLAASLAVEAKMLQGLIAMHRLDYVKLGIHIAGAVRYSRVSDDKRLLPIMLSHQGNVYTLHLPSTKKATPPLLEGLANSDAPLSRADLSTGLAEVYALQGKEDKALEMIKQARDVMPDTPEQDPLYHLIDFGLADLDRVEGRVYLVLAEKLKSRDYAELAYKAFAQGTSKQATSSRSQSQTLIHQADAALAIDDLRTALTCLEQGANIALQIKSLKRQQEVRTILEKAPDAWKNEQAYEDLVKMF